MTTDFLSETMEARRQQDNIIKVVKKKRNIGWAQWLTPIISALWEAEAGRPFEVKAAVS